MLPAHLNSAHNDTIFGLSQSDFHFTASPATLTVSGSMAHCAMDLWRTWSIDISCAFARRASTVAKARRAARFGGLFIRHGENLVSEGFELFGSRCFGGNGGAHCFTPVMATSDK